MSELWAENEMDSDVKREIENKCNLLAKNVCAAHGNLKEKGTRNSTREKWIRNINRAGTAHICSLSTLLLSARTAKTEITYLYTCSDENDEKPKLEFLF